MQTTPKEKQRKAAINLVRSWKISYPVIAEKMDMPLGTFKNKLNESSGKYQFSESEGEVLVRIIGLLLAECKTVYMMDEVDMSDIM